MLTSREREVLQLMAEGRSNAAIATALWLTERTVETRVHSIFVRLGLFTSPPTTSGADLPKLTSG